MTRSEVVEELLKVAVREAHGLYVGAFHGCGSIRIDAERDFRRDVAAILDQAFPGVGLGDTREIGKEKVLKHSEERCPGCGHTSMTPEAGERELSVYSLQCDSCKGVFTIEEIRDGHDREECDKCDGSKDPLVKWPTYRQGPRIGETSSEG